MSSQKCRFCQKMNPPGSRFCNFCGNNLTVSIQPDGLLPNGTVLRGSYVIENKIGEGGMGVVYSCHHKTLGTRYALKVLDPKLARIDLLRQRFLAEAKIQAKVVHPHIVHVMDVLDSDKDGGIPGVLAIVMEYIEGEALDQMLDRSPLSEKDTVSCALVMLDAIGFAHHAGIVHRDLKPSNIMISGEEAKEALHCGIKVMDFGIAKLLQENEQRTVTGAKMGTTKYMAPEQIENARDVDERADLYAIGITMYEMLCGRTPFEEFREFELMKAHMTMKPPSMRTWRSDVSDRLEAIIMKALEKDRNNRYPNAESFQRALLSLGGYDDIKLLLNPYEGTSVLPTNQKLQRKIERAIDRTRARNQEGDEPKKTGKTRLDKRAPKKSEAAPAAVTPKKPEDSSQADAFARTEASVVPRKSPTHPSIIQISREKRRTNPDAKSRVTFKRGRTVHENAVAKASRKTQSGVGSQVDEKPVVTDNAAMKLPESARPVETPKAPTQSGMPQKAFSASLPQAEPSENRHKPSSSAHSPRVSRPQAKPVASSEVPVATRKKHTALKLVFIILCILCAAGLYYRYTKNMPLPEPPINAVQDKNETESAFNQVREIQTETGRMTVIPAAKHWVSGDRSDELRPMQLDSFAIDQVEVSYFQYNKCIEAEKCPPLSAQPDDWTQPVTQVGYGSAAAFCEFAGKSLPSREQWEAAARYGGETNGITFVNVSCDTIHFGSGNRGECKKRNPNAPESVFKRAQSANPGHILNMLGNVREWTSTPDATDPQKHITKGGSYLSPRADINISVNQPSAVNSGAPDLGFRCIKTQI